MLIGPAIGAPGAGARLALNGSPLFAPIGGGFDHRLAHPGMPLGQPQVVHGRTGPRAQDALARGAPVLLAGLGKGIKQGVQHLICLVIGITHFRRLLGQPAAQRLIVREIGLQSSQQVAAWISAAS